MKKQSLVVLTGAGISAESGLATFRDAGGLWEGFDVMEVASIGGWNKDRKKVLDFYNLRRKQAFDVKPNRGHIELARLEKDFDVTIITQNVDNLHEQAGSTNVVHLHGELFKIRSTVDENLVYDLQGWELNLGDLCEKGSQLRPHIVWFGEMVPMMDKAARIASKADIFLVVGTSLQVYPAAGLIDIVPDAAPKFVIDPYLPDIYHIKNLKQFNEKASTGVKKVASILRKEYLD